MLSDELKKKLAAVPEEEPDETDLAMMKAAEAENVGSMPILADDYFARRP